MMDGRVKTLHPRVHGGILARRVRPGAPGRRRGSTASGSSTWWSVNLYPFAAAAANPATPFDGLVEEIDIGGPSLVRGAAKNFADVLVVVSPADYPAVLARAGPPGRSVAGVPVRPGAQGVRAHGRLRHGDRLDARRGVGRTAVRSRAAGQASAPAAADAWRFGRCATCATARTRTRRRRGTPTAPRTALGDAAVLQGKELSYTNLLDLDAAARIVLEFAEPAAAVIKHTNPCGAATGASAADAYVRARDADRAVGVRRHRRAQPRRSTSTTARAIVSTTASTR